VTGLRICEYALGGLHLDLERHVFGFYNWPKHSVWLDCHGALEEPCKIAFEENIRDIEHSKFSNVTLTLCI
jgi:hypothetical protein